MSSANGTKRFLLIAGVTAVIAAAAAFIVGQGGSTAAEDGTPERLVTDLADRAGDIARIEIVSGSGTLELVRTDGRWTLPANDGYPADLTKVRELVAGIEAIEPVEQKTANPANHARLGLNTPEPDDDDDAPAGAPVRVRLLAEDASTIADVILGNRTATGVFVRTAGADQTWLAESVPDASSEPNGWYDQRPVQVERDEVRTVTIEHPDGETVRIVRDGEGFKLAELPEGTQPIGPWQAGQTAGALGFLTVEDVRAASAIEFDAAERTTVTFELEPTDDAESPSPGLIARVAEVEGRAWATFEATGPGAEAVNETTRGWAYAISSFTRDALVKRTGELVEPIEPADDSGGPEVPAALSPPSDD